MDQKKLMEAAGSVILSTEGQSLTLLYVDGTEGWKSVQDSKYKFTSWK
jgi:hypothetical protein